MIIAGVELTEEADTRLSPLMLPGGRLQTSTLYQLLHAQGATDDGAAKFVWNSAAPPRVRFFGWLLSRDRIQSKANLLKKSVVTDATCELCNSGAETAQHIVFGCPFAHSFWAALGFHLPAGQAVQAIHQLPRPPSFPAEHFATFALLCCWQLWKRRNSFVFRQETTTMRHALRLCREDARLWSHRLPRSTRAVAQHWCNRFSSAK
jgi:hypothetical protein